MKRFLPLCLLLSLTVVVEQLAGWMIYEGFEFVWLYHIFVIFEYALLCGYFIRLAAARYQRYIRYSIFLFALISISVSYWFYRFGYFPGLNINTEGVLICITCTYVLLNLDIHLYDKIRKHPDFWISSGLLAFFGGTFFSNGLYSYMMELDRSQALRLFGMVNRPLNIILYCCLIIGFLCAIPRKSTIQLY